MTRTMIAYGGWVGDTRQALNQFVTDMGEPGGSGKADWLGAYTGWLGLAGTIGGVGAALITSVKTLLDALEGEQGGLSIADMSDRENAALQAMSEKVRDVNSDLPIYVALRERRAAEPPALANDPENAPRVSQATLEFEKARRATATELNAALAALPRPGALRQRLAIAWIKRGVSPWDMDSMRGSIAFFCQAEVKKEADRPPIWAPTAPVRGPGTYITELKVGLSAGLGEGRGSLPNESGTLKAVKGAYRGTRLLDLPLNAAMHIRTSGGGWIIWTRRGGNWAPVIEAGPQRSGHRETDPFGTEEGTDIFKAAIASASQLTVEDLRSFDDAESGW